MRFTTILTTLLLTIALTASVPGSTADSPEQVIASDCEWQIGEFPVDPSLAPALPPGFSYATYEEFVLGLPVSVVGDYALFMIAYTCADMMLDGVSLGPVSALETSLFVHPPEDEAREGAAWHAVAFNRVVTNEDLAAAYAAHGFPVEVGTIDYNVAATPVARTGTAHATSDSLEVLLATEVAVLDPTDAITVRLFAVDSAEVTGTLDVDVGASPLGLGGGASLRLATIAGLVPISTAGLGVHQWDAGFSGTLSEI